LELVCVIDVQTSLSLSLLLATNIAYHADVRKLLLLLLSTKARELLAHRAYALRNPCGLLLCAKTGLYARQTKLRALQAKVPRLLRALQTKTGLLSSDSRCLLLCAEPCLNALHAKLRA
jgi:hypothetical protein